jgi:hypothetical protein
VYSGAQARSFEQASRDLAEIGEVAISVSRVMRATKRIGEQRVAERDQQTKDWQALTIPARRRTPTGSAPPVACVEMDGGRMQIRDRGKSAPSRQPGDRKGRFWRETKVGCCLSLASLEHPHDPCPTLPAPFASLPQMGKIAREIKGSSSPEPATSSAEQGPQVLSETREAPRPGRPEVLVRTVVATRRDIDAFGPMLAAAAHARGFAAAPRKVFVADGLEANWSVWRQYFSHYTPVVDIIHALCYVYAAAVHRRPLDEATSVHAQWAQWLWSGRIDDLLAALQQRQQSLGPPPEGSPASQDECPVAVALRYLTNQRSRMNYAEYRRLGLPITSSHIESIIKQLNRRVKGSEKFWSEGAEPLLQLGTDYLSETQPLDAFWNRQASRATGQRCYC